MTSQGTGDGGAGRAPDEETLASWEPPTPDAPPAPAAPARGQYPGSAAAPPPPGAAAPQGYGPPGGVTAPPGGVWAPPAPGGAAYGVPGVPAIRFAGTLPRVLAWMLDGLLVGIVAGLLAGVVGAFMSSAETAAIVTTIVYMGLELLYFVGFWTGGSRATPGMRVFSLQIGNAADGRALTMNQALVRWVALGLPFQALALLPPPASSIGGIAALWALVLLITTIASPTKQGLHDRWAGSAIVQPVGRDGPVVACLILAVLVFVILPILAIGAFIFVGAQVFTILSEVGTSI